MYRWRKLSSREKVETLHQRHLADRPVHSLPHYEYGNGWYILTAACFEHAPHIGHSDARMDSFAETLLTLLATEACETGAWVILPNHYHVIVRTNGILPVLKSLGQLHGRSSFTWNGEENTRGRKIWCNTMDRPILTDDHHYEALNYVHHNPVKHGYVTKWTDWKWSSAADHIKEKGRGETERQWKAFPPGRFSAGLD